MCDSVDALHRTYELEEDVPWTAITGMQELPEETADNSRVRNDEELNNYVTSGTCDFCNVIPTGT